jgi:peptidoglycan/LPS O-acetylase OafA/YrhL
MDRLSIYLTFIVGAVTTGALVVAVLVAGWYSWPAIGGATAVGFILAWPVSYMISRRIKRLDKAWDETKVHDVPGGLPDPAAPEV